MNRRLYFLIPDRAHALVVVEDLVRHGIDIDHMHAVGDRRTRLDGLPNASQRQKNDSGGRLEKLLWNCNLTCFFIALATAVTMPLLTGPQWWLLIPVGIMAANFLLGLKAINTPNAHLGEFRDALSHGEILLLVDIPETRVHEVSHDIHHQHPEAMIGGVGWGTQAFGL
jgi:hypothetical protein